MTANQLLQVLLDGLFILVFVVVGVQALREPRRARIDTALLFGDIGLIILISLLIDLTSATNNHWTTAVTQVLLMALPYLLLRLVEDFQEVPVTVARGAIIGLALSALSFFVIPPPIPGALIPLYVVYFVYLSGYVAAAFIRAARTARGVTKRRLTAVAGGTLALGLVIVFAGLDGVVPGLQALWTALSSTAALGAGLGFLLGFAPPAWLRHAWQEPELRDFFNRAAALPRLATIEAVINAIEQGAAQSVGMPNAAICLWDEQAGVLRVKVQDAEATIPPGRWTVGKAFAAQKPVLSLRSATQEPDAVNAISQYGTNTVLAAPITAGGRRLGVLAAYAPRAPFFVEDDLQLVALLANLAAVVLDSHTLIEEAAQVRVREEAARLKDEFLSVAAHDLKTPLTAVVAQAQLMERRARRSPEKPPDLAGLQRLVAESLRLRRLVTEILDMARVEQGRLLGQLEQVDLVAIAEQACSRLTPERLTCTVQSNGPVTGAFDRARVTQLLDNLVENAVKYSPDSGHVTVRVHADGQEACIEVQDEGIGIPSDDIAHLFERFHRAANAERSEVTGLGLGLYICKGIVEEHGGRIWATSPGAGAGSTFFVRMPIRPVPDSADCEAPAAQVEDLVEA